MGRGKVYAGTSGYSYTEWKGSFYPDDLAQSGFLEFYAGVFSTVEINNTFYRFPATGTLESWRDSTPDAFTFAVKANRGITHRGRLKDVAGLTRDFVDRCRTLGPKLGPILFQLPPYLKRDDQRLADFLAITPPDVRCAVEFRHASWFVDEVWSLLAEHGVALCISEGEKLDTPRHAAGGFCYLRLRKDEYDPAELRDWREWIDGQLAEGRDVFAYLKHDEEGASPEYVLRILEGS